MSFTLSDKSLLAAVREGEPSSVSNIVSRKMSLKLGMLHFVSQGPTVALLNRKTSPKRLQRVRRVVQSSSRSCAAWRDPSKDLPL